MNEQEKTKYEQSVRKELGKFSKEKLQILFSESLAELKRRELRESFDFLERTLGKNGN